MCQESTPSLQSAVIVPHWSLCLIKLLKHSTGRFDPLPHCLKKWWLAPFLPKILWFTSLWIESFHAKFAQRNGQQNFNAEVFNHCLSPVGLGCPHCHVKNQTCLWSRNWFYAITGCGWKETFPALYSLEKWSNISKAPMERPSAKPGQHVFCYYLLNRQFIVFVLTCFLSWFILQMESQPITEKSELPCANYSKK